jgi:cytochrome c
LSIFDRFISFIFGIKAASFMKDSLTFNKICAAVLIALAVAWIAGTASDSLVSPKELAKNVFVVDTGAVASATSPSAAAAPQGPAPIEPLLASANVDAGQKDAKVCGTCHSFGKGEPAKIGPNLYGIIGSVHAHMAGFAYSDAMKALASKTWTFAELNEFIFSPRDHIPGTKMTFAGIKNDTDRANVIAWLRTLSDSPAPLPGK